MHTVGNKISARERELAPRYYILQDRSRYQVLPMYTTSSISTNTLCTVLLHCTTQVLLQDRAVADMHREDQGLLPHPPHLHVHPSGGGGAGGDLHDHRGSHL